MDPCDAEMNRRADNVRFEYHSTKTITSISFALYHSISICAKERYIKSHDVSVKPIMTRLYVNNIHLFTQRRNSYAERRIMVFCRQIVDKEKGDGARNAVPSVRLFVTTPRRYTSPSHHYIVRRRNEQVPQIAPARSQST